jgi:hypothetical protein
MGRKRSDKEDERNKPTPKKSTPIKSASPSATCDRCSASVPARSDGTPMAHYLGDGKTWCK